MSLSELFKHKSYVLVRKKELKEIMEENTILRERKNNERVASETIMRLRRENSALRKQLQKHRDAMLREQSEHREKGNG